MKKIQSIFNLEKGFAYVSIGNIAYFSLSALLWLYLATLLNAENYGELNYEISVVTILTAVGLMGFDTTLTALVAKGSVKIEGESHTLVFAGSLAISAFLVLVFNSYSMAVLLTGMLYFSWVAAYLLGKQKFKDYMIIMTLQRGLSIFIVPVLYASYSIDGALLGWGFAYLVLCSRYFKFFKKTTFSFEVIRKIRRFFVHSYILGIAKTLPYFVDKLIILPVFGAVIVGYYQLGSQISMITSIVPFVLYSYLLPKESQGGGVRHRRTKWFGMLSSVVVTIILFASVPFIVTNFFPRFEAGIDSARILLIASVPLSLTAILNSTYMGSGRSQPVIVGTAIFVASQYSLILVLGTIYSLNGLASATVIASTLQCVYLCVYRKSESISSNKLDSMDVLP